jgi:hypothetical protein
VSAHVLVNISSVDKLFLLLADAIFIWQNKEWMQPDLTLSSFLDQQRAERTRIQMCARNWHCFPCPLHPASKIHTSTSPVSNALNNSQKGKLRVCTFPL